MLIPTLLAHAGEAAGGSHEFPIIHPILVNFTAALLPTSVAADLLGRIFHRESLRSTGWWTLLLGAVLTPLTGLLGWLWMRSMEDMDHWQMPYHKWIGLGLAVAFILLAAWRGWLYRRDRWPTVPYFVVAILALGLLGFQGELGGSMSFGHTLLIAGDNSHPMEHDISYASHAKNNVASDSDHRTTHGSMLADGWKDHIDVSRPSTTQP